MSLKILDYFNYTAKKSLLHYVDPRTKILFVFVLTCITLLFRDLVPLIFILVIIIPLIFLGNFFMKWLKALLVILPLIILIIILNALLLKEEFATTLGIVIALRMIILTTVFGLFFQTISPDDISQTLIKFKFPYPLAWAISTSYRFIPTLSLEASVIIDAQKSRGLQIDRGNLFKRIKNMLPLLIPIFASAMRRSWQLAEAIESRGWNASKKRTYLYSLKIKWWDIILIIFLIALFALFLLQAIKQYELPYWMQWVIPKKYELKYLLSIAWNWFKSLFS